MASRDPLPLNQRRSPRRGLKVPLELQIGARRLRVETRVVNQSGALVLSRERLSIGTSVPAMNLRTRQRGVFRVAGAWSDDASDHFKLGLELTQEVPGFWGRAYERAPDPRRD